MPSPKRDPEYREGPDAARAAESMLQRVLTIPKHELERRESAYKHSRKKTRRKSRSTPA